MTDRVAMTGLLEINLASDVIRWCDGGFINHDGNVYRAIDATFGTVQKVDTLQEGLGDNVPAMTMMILPPSIDAAAQLSSPGNQTGRVTFILAEYDYDTGVVTSADIQFVGQIDQAILTVGRAKREINMSVVSLAERLFEGDTGNTMNSTFQKAVFPGDTGQDQATGLGVPVAWGTDAPTRGALTGTVFGSHSIFDAMTMRARS